MLRYKSNKQACIIAALVILLCLVCLAGSTLALFTSNSEDGKIGIVTTAGNIRVDILDRNGQSLEGLTLDFESVDGKSITALFEPGATFRTEPFYVHNGGNINIRFRMYISNDPNMDMEEFNRGFEVWIADSKGNKVPIDQFSELLEPSPGLSTSEAYYLYVHMKESAGNEFNKNNGQTQVYYGIGITIYAVQGNADVNTKE